MNLWKFGTNNPYFFPPITDYTDNFNDLVQRVTRLPNVDGGYREYGSHRSPSEIGNVRVGFWLFADNPTSMQFNLDQLAALHAYGLTKLYRRTLDSSSFRWCEAEVSSIQFPQNARDMPSYRQRVVINFSVADPHWYEIGNEQYVWGDDTWNEAFWGNPAVTRTLSTNTTTFTETVLGNAVTYPRFVVTNPTGVEFTTLTIRRLNGAEILDEVVYTGTLSQNETLEIDCRKQSVTVNGTSAYNSFTYLKPSWFRLMPGQNTIRAILGTKLGNSNLTLRYYTRWKS